MSKTHLFKAEYLHATTRQMLIAGGTPRHIADDVAGILVNANLAGHDSHGVLRIPAYLNNISEGRLKPDAEPETLKETATTMLIDGKDGFGHYVALRGLSMAIEKAKESNVCNVSLLRTGHIGRLGEYAEIAAAEGFISIITTGLGQKNQGATVPFGGAEGRLSTNPIAIGVPTGDNAPFIMDFATSVVAEGKIQVARSKDADLPQGYIIDKHGNPSVKPEDFYDGGNLLPFGGHKGYGLSLLVCLLGGLDGNFDAETGTMAGTFMQVMKVDAFTPLGDYQGNVRAFLDGIKETPPAPGFDEVLVPGDFESRSRSARLANGIQIPDAIYKQIHEWAEKLDVTLSEEIVEDTDIKHYQNKQI